MFTSICCVEENIHSYYSDIFSKLIKIRKKELIKKIYDVEFIINYESLNFRSGKFIITSERFALISILENQYKVNIEEIKEIKCLLTNADQNKSDLFIKINSEASSSEIIIKHSSKTSKIIDKLADNYKALQNIKLIIHLDKIENFLSEKSVHYINLSYGDIISYYKPLKKRISKLSDYKKLALIGQGNNGRVFLVRNINDNNQYAIKVLKKNKIIKDGTMKYIRFEKYILEHIDNNFLLKLKSFFQTAEYLFIVTDYMQGDLFSLIIQNSVRLSEKDLGVYIVCIALALQCLHDNQLVYRDLKPENILLGNDGYPILCDFGLVNLVSYKTCTFCGTSEYFAPEIITSNSYDEKVDWWALGILIYELLYLDTPFKDINTYSLYEKILNDPIEFPEAPLISENAKDLILRLLEKNPLKRLGTVNGAREIFKHKFFKNLDILSIEQKKLKPPKFIIEENENSYVELDFNESDFCDYEEEEEESIKYKNEKNLFEYI